ncbi:MAG: dephospho-CoA kinase [Betaproteobacteria bacterium]|jgi:dephospho-CoA kinase|nr:dephospho-CoA kinase [Betaproteobacteria bacterium]
MPFVIGLTGGIGSGKSAAADEFARLGATLVDTDAIAHALTAPGGAAIDAVRTLFGDSAIDASGAMDRAWVRARVFADPDARRRLEAVLHPLIRRESSARVRAAPGPYVVLVVPLLVESQDYRARVDRVLVVDCPVELQVARVCARSGLSEEEVRRIITAQVSREARLAAADDVIDNSGTLEALRSQVQQLHTQYLVRAASA